MSSVLPLAGFLLLTLLVTVALAVQTQRSATGIEYRAQRHLRLTRGMAVVAGLGTFGLCAQCGVGLGLGLMAAPSMAGAVSMCVLAIGERTLPTERSDVRVVSLEPREGAKWLTKSTRWVALVVIAFLSLVFILGALTAKADDAGRPSRAVEWATREGDQSHSPWPGWYYSLPAVVSLLVAGAACFVALRWVARRPQLNADTRVAVSDEQMRRRSAHLLQGVLLVVLGLSLAGFALVTALATAQVAPGAPWWVNVAHWLGTVGAVVGVVAVFAGARTSVER